MVTVVDTQSASPHTEPALQALHAALTTLAAPFEIVVVVNGGRAQLMEALHRVTEELPDIQCYALQFPVDRATAYLAGLENAVGDWVGTLDLEADRPEDFTALFDAALRERTEVALGRTPRRHLRRSWPMGIPATLFHRLFRSLHGFSLEDSTPTLRLMARHVVNAIVQHDTPLVAFDTLAATSGYRKTFVEAISQRPRITFREKVRARWRVLIGLNALPLRLANALCGVGACVAVLYTIYTVAVYTYKQDVMPGWTTVSLMLSCIFFLLSLVLGLLSEYMIMLLDSSARRPRYHTAGEFGSQHQSRRHFLNVESESESEGAPP